MTRPPFSVRGVVREAWLGRRRSDEATIDVVVSVWGGGGGTINDGVVVRRHLCPIPLNRRRSSEIS